MPVPVPGLIPKIPKLLFGRNQPLFLRWSYLPRLLVFLLPYLANGRHAPVERISAALAELLRDSPDQHLALAAGTGAERFVRKSDYLFAYDSRNAYKSDRAWVGNFGEDMDFASRKWVKTVSLTTILLLPGVSVLPFVALTTGSSQIRANTWAPLPGTSRRMGAKSESQRCIVSPNTRWWKPARERFQRIVPS